MLLAHRGGVEGTDLAENSLAALERAMVAYPRVSGVEIDLRRCADGVIVVHHDECCGNVPLKELNHTVLSVPTLDDVLDLVERLDYQGLVNLEIKEYGIVEELMARLAPLRAHFLLSSFLHTEVLKVNAYDRAFVMASYPPVRPTYIGAKDHIAIHGGVINWDTITTSWLWEMRARVLIWTVNDRLLKNEDLHKLGFGTFTDRICDKCRG